MSRSHILPSISVSKIATVLATIMLLISSIFILYWMVIGYIRQVQTFQRDELTQRINEYHQKNGTYPESLNAASIQAPQPDFIHFKRMIYHTNDDRSAFQLQYTTFINVYCYYSGNTDKPVLSMNLNIPTQKDTWQICWNFFDTM